MKIFVESAGKSPEHDYNWIDEQQKIIEKPNIIKSFLGLLQQDSPSLLIGRKSDKLLLIVTGISSERRDYQNRIIRISVAWIVEDNHVYEAKIRSLASKILSPVTGEIDPKQSIEACVKAGVENGFTVDVEDFESLRCLLEKEPENCSPSKSLDKKLEINSKDTIKQLADELKERSLPEGDRPLVVVTGIQSRADFKKAKVWRGLANFVDERGGQKEEEINFRENIQGYKQSDDRHSKGGRKANEGSIQKRIVISVLAILFCVSLALGIWFYIQSKESNPKNQQQNDNINSSNKPIQTLIMEPKAVQKELIPQEKTEELKEEKIKIMELKNLLLKAGFTEEPGEVSNTKWSHPLLPGKVILSGKDGNDAKPYQERDVINALNTLAKIKEDQQR
ncbi:type II toxin-antitoxin system HicA family toxin [Planktothrix agardhii]|uniref:type II toxin-antitoxin system HicA family toxin n=1 Tax=Planktothrix agardhii TaxID=1160 RepID=UPI002E308A87|nr:type II toxin-antitoxin system HicA family toxin [Planktothrix agardhii]